MEAIATLHVAHASLGHGKVNEITSRWKVLSVLNITMLQLPWCWSKLSFVQIIQEHAARKEKVQQMGCNVGKSNTPYPRQTVQWRGDPQIGEGLRPLCCCSSSVSLSGFTVRSCHVSVALPRGPWLHSRGGPTPQPPDLGQATPPLWASVSFPGKWKE